MFAGFRLRTALGTVVMMAAASSITACHKRQPDPPAVVKKTPAEMQALSDTAKKSLDGLNPLLAERNAKFAELRPQFEALPPDLPEFGLTRGKFFGVQEALGRMNSEVPWLQGRIDTAVKSGDSTDLDDVSKAIQRAYDDMPEIDKVYLELIHELPPFQREAAQLKEQAKAQAKVSCEPDKGVTAAAAASLFTKKAK